MDDTSIGDTVTRRRPVDLDALASSVLANERAGLAKAITLIESTRDDHREQAQQLLLRLLPQVGGAIRVGITGVPGVGKSTFIDALGMYLIGKGHRVAVLAVDPSSTRTGGRSWATRPGWRGCPGNRTLHPPVPDSRHPRRCRQGDPRDDGAARGRRVRRDPRRDRRCRAVGGHRRKHGGLLLFPDARPYRRPTAGNQEGCARARRSRRGEQGGRQPRARRTCRRARTVRCDADGASSRCVVEAARDHHEWSRRLGLDTFWDTVLEHKKVLTEAGQFDENRSRQQVDWTWTMVHDQLLRRLESNPRVKAIRGEVESGVRDGSLTAAIGAQRILDAFDGVDDGAAENVDPAR